MNHLIKSGARTRQMANRAHCHGTSSLEAIMAFTLLGSVLAASTPLIVRHKQLIASQREYRLALDEVSNQMERLSVQPHEGLATAVQRIRPSDFVVARLPHVKLSAKVGRADNAQHVQLTITWGDEQQPARAITLASWFFQEQDSASPPADRRVSP